MSILDRAKFWAIAVLASTAVWCLACGNPPPRDVPDAPSPATLDDAERVLDHETSSIDAILKAADQMSGLAASEGTTKRGALAALLAGKLWERAFRMSDGLFREHADHALQWWANAETKNDLATTCEAAVLAGKLEGELMHDPTTAYTKLFAAKLRLRATPCAGAIDAQLDRIAMYRPPLSVLRTLDPDYAPASSASNGHHAPTILRVARWSTQDSARVLVEVDQPVEYHLESSGSLRFDLTLAGVEFARAKGVEASIEPTKGLLRSGTIAGQNGGTQISLSLTKQAYGRVLFLPDPFRVVADFSVNPPAQSGPSQERNVRRVVLDPGHGGSDPGATGVTGLREKDVTLDIAKRAKPILESELGLSVDLTRSDDSNVSLEDRTAIANATNADLFLSIHCNASEMHNRTGFEIYVLDSARDDLAAKLASRENGGGRAAPSELAAMISEMKQADLREQSRAFASDLERASTASVQPTFPNWSDGGVHGAGFFVLVGTRMPAALFEIAFVSTPAEEALLARNDFRARIVDGIVNAIRAYKESR